MTATRTLTADELAGLSDLGVACPGCGRPNDWIVEQDPQSGQVVASCDNCDQVSTSVPMSVVERHLEAAGASRGGDA